MAVTQDQINALNTAIANGERIVRMGDKLVEYRSVAELIQARNDLQSQLTNATTPNRPRQTHLYQSGRGLD